MTIFNSIIATFFGLFIIAIYLLYTILKKLLKIIEQLMGGGEIK